MTLIIITVSFYPSLRVSVEIGGGLNLSVRDSVAESVLKYAREVFWSLIRGF